MRSDPAHFLAAAVISVSLVAGAANAADVSDSGPVVEPSPEFVRDYLKRRALLHIIRATFDVEAVEDIPSLIADDKAAAEKGVSQAVLAELDADLIAEGSYFIVSLEYLVKAGYPAWPEDKPQSTYVNDALAQLDPLPEELVATVQAGGDPIEVLNRAAEVYRWTEGGGDAPTDRANFDARDELVESALSDDPPEPVSL